MAHRSDLNLPESLVQILVQPLEEIPTGKWKDFNKLHKFWRILKNNSDNDNACSKELLLLEDVPDEPDVDDYPDITGILELSSLTDGELFHLTEEELLLMEL